MGAIEAKVTADVAEMDKIEAETNKINNKTDKTIAKWKKQREEASKNTKLTTNKPTSPKDSASDSNVSIKNAIHSTTDDEDPDSTTNHWNIGLINITYTK